MFNVGLNVKTGGRRPSPGVWPATPACPSRVRRLSTGQTTDAFLGTDVMIEDFEGYNDRISDMNWAYKGTRYTLTPFFNHNELQLDNETHQDSDGYQVVGFGGQRGYFP